MININIIQDNIKLTPRDKEMIDDKLLRKVDERMESFDDSIKDADVKVVKKIKPLSYSVSFDMWLPGKEHIYAEAIDEHLVSALVELRKHVLGQLESYIGRLNN